MRERFNTPRDRVPDHPPKPPAPARVEATPFGLAFVVEEPIRTEAARWLLDDINRQVDEIEAQRHRQPL